MAAVRGRWRFRPPCTVTVATTKACTPPPRPVHPLDPGSARSHRRLVPIRARRYRPESGQRGSGYAVREDVGKRNLLRPVPRTDRGIHFPGKRARDAHPGKQFQHHPVPGLRRLPLDHRCPSRRAEPEWPSSVAPPPVVCATPTIIGAPFSVSSGATISLSGSVAGGRHRPPSRLQWTAGYATATANDLNGALTGATTTTPKFNAHPDWPPGTYFLNFERIECRAVWQRPAPPSPCRVRHRHPRSTRSQNQYGNRRQSGHT